MKSVAIGVVFICSLILGSAFLMTMEGKSIREQELNDSVSIAMKREAEQLLTNLSEGELEQALSDSFWKRIRGNGSIRVQILAADSELGMLAVRVYESYQHPNGMQGSLETERVLIKESVQGDQEQLSLYKVIFQVEGDEYRTFQVEAGQRIRTPEAPERDSYQFLGWMDEEKNLAGEWIEVINHGRYEACYTKEGE